MSHASERSRVFFSVVAHLYGGGHGARPFAYRASYSKPRRDRQGCIRFGWTATVIGVERQPPPRTTIVDQPADTGPDWVERRIQRSIEEHLAIVVGMATRGTPR